MNDDPVARYVAQVEKFNAAAAIYRQQVERAERLRRRKRTYLALSIIFFVIGVILLAYALTHWPFP